MDVDFRMVVVDSSQTENILGYPVTNRDAGACIRRIRNWMRSGGKPRVLVCANPHSLALADSDPAFRAAIMTADLVTPDGVGMVLASMLLGGRLRRRITGSDIFLGVSRMLDREGGWSYFFLGSSENNLTLLRRKFEAEFPNIRIAGTFAPPFQTAFDDKENRRIIDTVNKRPADVLWVSMTAPKQEKWVHQNRENLNVRFIGAVGAVFDFYTGRVRRSPRWFLGHGLEWLPRLCREPGRLWSRTILSAPKFLIMVLRQRANR